ncbi:Sec-independent protein translocase subunit TatB [Streptomyces sp. NPDC057291]|uniref:Sec-independent protein translocase subunit TatB n=1 Tax=Streptomyces sp. NPDC057291 TaxID=3346087 RepID=UPI0036257F52
MFSDIGPLEVVTLIVLAVILVGPDKLPKMVSDTARTLRKVRELSQSAQASIRDELPPELQNLTLEDFNPKALVAKNLLSAESLNLTDLTTGFDLEEEPSGGAAGETSKNPGESVGPGSKSTTAGHRA